MTFMRALENRKNTGTPVVISTVSGAKISGVITSVDIEILTAVTESGDIAVALRHIEYVTDVPVTAKSKKVKLAAQTPAGRNK